MSTSRFAVGMSCAVFALTLVSSAFGRTVSASVARGGADEPTGFNLEFGTPTADEIDTLYIAYGPTDAGETTNGWAHVARVNCISADGTGGDLVVNDATDSCFVPLPEDFGEDDYARFFLFSGETGVPYDQRYDSMKSTVGEKTSNAPWIDTEIVPTTETSIDITYTVGSEGMPPFGVENNFYCFGARPNESYYGMLLGNSAAISYNCLNGKFRVRLSKDGAYVDDHLLGVPEPQRERCTGSITLFGRNQDIATSATSVNRSCKCTIWSATIYEAGVPVRDFFSVKKGEVNGLYDRVSGRFFKPFRDPSYKLSAGTLVSTVVPAAPQCAASNVVKLEGLTLTFSAVKASLTDVTFTWNVSETADIYALVSVAGEGEVTTNLLRAAASAGQGSAQLTLAENTAYVAQLLAEGDGESVLSGVREFTTPVDVTKFRQWKSTITFPGYASAQRISNLPVLLKIGPDTVAGFRYSDCAADGSDLLVVDESGGLLPYEIETWNPSGTSLVWVKVPDFGSGCHITLLWSDAGTGADIPAYGTAKDVWSDYVGVWHLDESSGDAVDSTGHGLSAVPTGARKDEAVGISAGAVGGARTLVNTASGNNAYLLVPNDAAFVPDASVFTISGFFKRNGSWQGTSGQYPIVFAHNRGAVSPDKYSGWTFNLSVNEGAYTVRGASSSSQGAEDGPTLKDWGHLAVVYDGPAASIFGDGVLLLNQGAITPAAENNQPLGLGCLNTGADNAFNGWMDEVRLYAGAMSAARVKAEYDTMTDNATFTGYGAAEPCHGEGGRFVDLSETPGDTSVSISGFVTDADGNPISGLEVSVAIGTDRDALEPVATRATTDANGAFTLVIGELAPGTAYFYQLASQGAGGFVSSVRGFATLYESRRYRLKKCELSFPGYALMKVLDDFPVLVKLSANAPVGFDYADCAADGSDLLVSDESGAVLPYEIETWDPSGTSLVWVKVPHFTAATRVRLYWGVRPDAPALPALDAKETWSGYAGVWHLDEDSGTAADATGHGLDGTPAGSQAARMVATNDAVVGRARVNRDGGSNISTSRLEIPSYDDLKIGSTFTASGFFKLNASTWPGSATVANYPRLFSRDGAGNDWSTSAWVVNMSSAPGLYTVRGAGQEASMTISGPVITNVWGHFAVSYNGAEASLYINGVLAGSGTLAAPVDNGRVLGIGGRVGTADRAFNGFMDEIRLAPWTVTPHRAKAEYDTMADNAAFTDYGEVEASSGEGVVFDSIAVTQGADGTAVAGLVLKDDAPAAGAEVRILCGTDPNELSEIATATCGEDGAFSAALTGLSAGLVYHCRVAAQAGGASATSARRRFAQLGASEIVEAACSVTTNVLTCAGIVNVGAGETEVVLLYGDAEDALTGEVLLAEFAAGDGTAEFAADVDIRDWMMKFCKVICRNSSGGQAWSDETQPVTRQYTGDFYGATYDWKPDVDSGAWDDGANWSVSGGNNPWPYTAMSAAAFGAATVPSVSVTSVPNCFVRSLGFETGTAVSLAVDSGATLTVTDKNGATNGTLTVADTDLHLTGGRLACEAISFARTAAAKPCAITVSDGGELWLGGSATLGTSAAELHVTGTGRIQLGRPDDGTALWRFNGDNALMCLGSESSEIRKCFTGKNNTVLITNGVHAGTFRYEGSAQFNVVRVSGAGTRAVSAIYLYQGYSTGTHDNEIIVEKGATFECPGGFAGLVGTRNVIRIDDGTLILPSMDNFGNQAGAGSGIEFCGTTPKLTVEGAWVSGDTSGAPVANAPRLIFNVPAAGYAAEPIEVKGVATVRGNTVFEVRVAKDSTQARIPLMKVASTAWSSQGDLKAVVDRLNSVAVLPEGARLVVSKDGKTLYCKRQTGLVLFVR